MRFHTCDILILRKDVSDEEQYQKTREAMSVIGITKGSSL